MKCKAVHEDLIFYLDGELPAGKQEQISKHLDDCAGCREFLAFLKENADLIRSERNPAVSPYFYTRLSTRLHEQKPSSENTWWPSIVQPAFFSILLIAGIYAGLKIGSSASSDVNTRNSGSGMAQYVNDFESEPIESYLLEQQ